MLVDLLILIEYMEPNLVEDRILDETRFDLSYEFTKF